MQLARVTRPVGVARPGRTSSVKVAAAWQKATTKSALQAAGGKVVAELGGQVRAARQLPLCAPCLDARLRHPPPPSTACTAAGATQQSHTLRAPLSPSMQQRILIVEDAGEVFAVSNKCSHLGLPIQVNGPRRMRPRRACLLRCSRRHARRPSRRPPSRGRSTSACTGTCHRGTMRRPRSHPAAPHPLLFACPGQDRHVHSPGEGQVRCVPGAWHRL